MKRAALENAGRVIANHTAVVFSLCTMAAPALAQWPQWGGKNRNFAADAKNLAAAWPEDGPKKLWSRTFGSGHSSIAFVDDRLYGMYREPEADDRSLSER